MRLKFILTVSALTLAAMLFTGCATTGKPQVTAENVAPAVKTAAMFGTIYSIREHPEWRPGFELAASELKVLSAADRVDFNLVLAIVSRLPVEELQGNDAQLIIMGATILLSGYSGGPAIDLDKVSQYRPIVVALAEGIDAGLKLQP